MAFDERGQADTAGRKIEICERAYRLLTDRLGFDPSDIVFDLNILAIATGLEEHNYYALDFLEAAKVLKITCPGVKICGGISNLSFAFRGNTAVREAMHSAFLFHATRSGLDMAIINAAQLTVYETIPADLLEHVEDVIFNRRATRPTGWSSSLPPWPGRQAARAPTSHGASSASKSDSSTPSSTASWSSSIRTLRRRVSRFPGRSM